MLRAGCFNEDEITVGPYGGVVSAGFGDAALRAALATIGARVDAADVLASGRHHNVRLSLPCQGQTLAVAVKRFGRQGWLKDRVDRRRGTKARRSWRAAEHLAAAGVGTPAPVAALDRWQGGRLVESYLLTVFQAGVCSFRDELDGLLRDDPHCSKIMDLLHCVANAVRDLHDAGFFHRDLGNQNVLLERLAPDHWGNARFIDLNRGRILDAVPLKLRARDLSRIDLPSDLFRVFKAMYYRAAPVPAAFSEWERRYRRRYRWHVRTRPVRHLVRTLRHGVSRGTPTRPSDRDLWIWDDRSAQAITTLRSRDKLPYYPRARPFQIAVSTVKAVGPVRREYRKLMASCFQSPVDMAGRIGMSIDPTPDTADRELALLARLGPVPVLVRFYHHEDAARRAFRAELVTRVHAAGHAVAVALVQDRAAVRAPARWQAFARETLAAVGDKVELVEVGHAINRVKWGVWGFEDHARLLDGMEALRGAYPGVRFMGPAVIDFEYPFLAAALARGKFRFDVLSHLLYVDRRGAPENRQGRFDAVAKFALARAIGRWAGVKEDRLIVSEVNWPIKGTGVYSPVNSPYETAGVRANDPSVDEQTYADYMIRYLLLALCSGLVERVYWWRLVARGFGLVDDSDGVNWRERPAYGALRKLLEQVGTGTFLRREAAAFVFRGADGEELSVPSPGPASP